MFVVLVIVHFEIETTQGCHLTFDANVFGIVANMLIEVIAIGSMFLVAFEIRSGFTSAVDRDDVDIVGGVSAVFVTHVGVAYVGCCFRNGRLVKSQWRLETMEVK